MRLRRSNLEGPGVRRRRRGRGFGYTHDDGSSVDAETRRRIDALVIPPAWREVWISPYPNGHIQAVGVDAAGRRQYLYHQTWREQRDELKFLRVLLLHRRLERVRSGIKTDLALRGLPRDRAVAAGLRLLDKGIFRSGGETYAEENESYGVATLLREHVALRKGEILLDFPAKSGVQRTVRLVDDPLAETIRSLRRASSGLDRLLVFRTRDAWSAVHADDLNDRFRVLAGDDFSVKDLRTWQGTVVAAVELALAPTPTTKAGRKRTERAAMERVAEELGNTPTVARASYVDPRVIERFEHGDTIAKSLQRLAVTDVDDLVDPRRRLGVERAVARLAARG